jgi:hypothetical protein
VLGRERQQGNCPGPFDRHGKPPLVAGARTGASARFNLALVGNEAAQHVDILVVDPLNLLYAECANAAALETATATFWAIAAVPTRRPIRSIAALGALLAALGSVIICHWNYSVSSRQRAEGPDAWP